VCPKVLTKIYQNALMEAIWAGSAAVADWARQEIESSTLLHRFDWTWSFSNSSALVHGRLRLRLCETPWQLPKPSKTRDARLGQSKVRGGAQASFHPER
jgi:hypothetical protein